MIGENKYSKIVLFFLVAIILGVFFSRAVMSIADVLIILIALPSVSKQKIKEITKCIPLWILGSIFLWQVLSLSNTEEFKEGIRIILRKTPYITFPLAICLLKDKITLKHLRIIFNIFIALAFVSSTVTIVNFLLHYEEILPRIQHSKSIPIIPHMEHIYFSTLVALAIIFSFFFYKDYPSWGLKKIPRNVYLIIALIMTVNLFLSTSRTGIFAFILAVSFEGLRYALERKKFKLLIVGGLMTILLAYGFSFMPPVKMRIKNTKKDLTKFLNNENLSDWSLSRRLAAIGVSSVVIKEHPVLGLGVGDMKTEFYSYYNKTDFIVDENAYITPHNEFLELATASGIVPAVLLLVLFIYLYSKFGLLGRTILLAIFFALQVELMLERQRGINFILLILMLLYIYYEQSNED